MNTLYTLKCVVLGTAITGLCGVTAFAQETATPTAPAVKPEVRHTTTHGRHHRRAFMGRGGSEGFVALFNQIDANADGTVTQEEVDTFRAAKLAEADTSGDGALSIEEFDTLYREFTRSRMVDMFQDYDADGDGVISQEEMDIRFGNTVEQMDRDGDGALTLQHRNGRN